jgi:3-phosphoshikimate 1-carboxyvinyltransferase
MYERPIGDLIDALRQLGADISYQKDDGFPPLLIKGKPLTGGEVSIKGNISSQYLTALLMVAPLFSGDTTINVDGELVSKPYIDITLDTMAKFGVSVANNNYQSFSVTGKQTYQSPGEIMIEGDASSASYFLAAAAIGGGPVKVHGTGSASIQGDAKFAEVLKQMGAEVTYSDMWIEVKGTGNLKGVDVDLNHIPDAAMTIATAALFAEGPTRIRNIYNWRVKETDRLAAMATELRKVGATVEEGDDYIYIEPPEHIQSAAIDTYNDHRMAMCFSLASFGDAEIVINDPKCTSKTFPTYFDEFARITK